jgi:hypothetical protein
LLAGVLRWTQPKIKLKKVENFQPSNKRHLHTTIHHTITTNPPANYHQKTHKFPEPPQKSQQNSKKSGSPAPGIFYVKFAPKTFFS